MTPTPASAKLQQPPPLLLVVDAVGINLDVQAGTRGGSVVGLSGGEGGRNVVQGDSSTLLGDSLPQSKRKAYDGNNSAGPVSAPTAGDRQGVVNVQLETSKDERGYAGGGIAAVVNPDGQIDDDVDVQDGEDGPEDGAPHLQELKAQIEGTAAEH